MSERTFVIGDVHGHLDQLMALLTKAGITSTDRVVQLGDLGHYGAETREADKKTWEFALTMPNFEVLYGNHEAALLWDHHRFSGQAYPLPGLLSLIASKELRFASAANGYLLTHAGLHPMICTPGPRTTVATLANVLNLSCEGDYLSKAARDWIAPRRGGIDPCGGLLWRDAREDLTNVKQVFGHSRSHEPRSYNNGTGFCIDVCDKGENPNLMGLWLPDLKPVAVGPDADFLERALEEQA